MTPILNLHILAQRLTQLSSSAFFDPAFRDFSQRTVKAIEHAIAHHDQYPDLVISNFEQLVWRVIQFVRGSRSNDAPYETQFVLRQALQEWIANEALISSAALEDLNFYLSTEDIWDYINRSLDQFDSGGYSPLVVQIGSPISYQHRPVFCIPLFHELGHFVDHHYEVSKLSLLLAPPNKPPAGVDPTRWNTINRNHRMEHFADLFAAAYCGEASKNTLLAIAPNNADSFTHPSTKRRVEVIEAFLSGAHAHPTVDLLQTALHTRTKKRLGIYYRVADVSSHFDDVLTYPIADRQELYGIFEAGWDYLFSQLASRSAPWAGMEVSDFVIEKTVNDLIEKSIRNFEIRERWNNVSNDEQ